MPVIVTSKVAVELTVDTYQLTILEVASKVINEVPIPPGSLVAETDIE